jgi:ATP-binding cassette, subfamily B, bacterial
MSFPFTRQMDSMDCGPACLQMILRYYRRDLAIQLIRERMQIGKEGANLLGISEAAETLGFRTHAVKLDFDTLAKDALLPCILHWNQNHFVVLYKVKKKRVYIADPTAGLVALPVKDFLPQWTSDESEGIALLLEPTPKSLLQEADEGSTGEYTSKLTIHSLFNYLMPFKRLIVQLLLGLVVASILQLILPFLTQSVVDVGIDNANIRFIYIILFAQAALTIGRLSVDFVRSWLLMHISTRVNISILTDFLAKLMSLPLSFFDSKKTGDILQRMNDHQRIESFLTGSSINILFSIVNLFIFSIVLAVFNVYIFSVFISASLLYSAWVIIFLKKRRALDYRRFAISSREQSATIQLIQGMQEIKLNGMEKPMRWGWESLKVKQFRVSMKGLVLNQWQQAGASLINEGKNIFITFLSAKAVVDGQITLGTMLAIQYIIGQLNSPIEQMLSFLQNWQNARISMERLNEVHSMEDEEPVNQHLLKELPISVAMQVSGGGVAETRSEGVAELMPEAAEGKPGRFIIHAEIPKVQMARATIHFSNVSFTYPGAGNEPVLRDINMSIPGNKVTAIVGTSGSGKTTLLKLLLKFYAPQKGDIRLGITSLSGMSHRIWRSHCGAVMQESYIFSDTIANNIAVGAERIDPHRLQYAISVANIHDFVASLPLGINTRIGSEGNGISMGQKQRILIARAVYRDPDFLFLDEATNSLDADNESVIVQNLSSFLSGRTVVIVAHRLSTVRHADQIIVLNKGTITERGTHRELIHLRGEYFRLVKNQLELGE